VKRPSRRGARPKGCAGGGQAPRSVVVIWSNYGPYHLARLEAAGRFFGRRGFRIVGVEIARTDRERAWTCHAVSNSFKRVTLFDAVDYRDLNAREVARLLKATLGEVTPCAVAVPGWASCEAWVALHWAVKNGVPRILMSATKEGASRRLHIREFLKRWLLQYFDAALVGGTPQKQYLVKLGMAEDRVFAGYDVVDNDFFATESLRMRRTKATASRNEGKLPDRFFLTVARLVPVKNLRRLLLAYANYRRAAGEQSWSLVICGSGPLRHELERFASKIRLEGLVWPGFVQKRHLPEYYGRASAFILPSLNETWGLVVNEAMASGLPILVSQKAGCCQDLVRSGENGYLFNPYDVGEMTEAMLKMSRLSETERAAMGARSVQILSSWSPQRFAEGLWGAVSTALTTRSQRHSLLSRTGLSIFTALLCFSFEYTRRA